VIRELQQLHDFLQSEGERLQRGISEYAQLSKATTNSTRLIADNMMNWKKGGEGKSTLSYSHNHVDASPMGPAFTVSG
jgi:hypothetical protein